MFSLLEKILFGSTKEERDNKFIADWMRTHPDPVDAGKLVICHHHKICQNFICCSHYPHEKDGFCEQEGRTNSCSNRELVGLLPTNLIYSGFPLVICIDIPENLKTLRYPRHLWDKGIYSNKLYKEWYNNGV